MVLTHMRSKSHHLQRLRTCCEKGMACQAWLLPYLGPEPQSVLECHAHWVLWRDLERLPLPSAVHCAIANGARVPLPSELPAGGLGSGTCFRSARLLNHDRAMIVPLISRTFLDISRSFEGAYNFVVFAALARFTSITLPLNQ
jgi:hypothetical protein